MTSDTIKDDGLRHGPFRFRHVQNTSKFRADSDSPDHSHGQSQHGPSRGVSVFDRRTFRQHICEKRQDLGKSRQTYSRSVNKYGILLPMRQHVCKICQTIVLLLRPCLLRPCLCCSKVGPASGIFGLSKGISRRA